MHQTNEALAFLTSNHRFGSETKVEEGKLLSDNV